MNRAKTQPRKLGSAKRVARLQTHPHVNAFTPDAQPRTLHFRLVEVGHNALTLRATIISFPVQAGSARCPDKTLLALLPSPTESLREFLRLLMYDLLGRGIWEYSPRVCL